MLVDYLELMRRLGRRARTLSALLVAKASLYRVPQIIERILPFCVLVGRCRVPHSVAAARIGGRARGRDVGLAVHRAGAGRGAGGRRFATGVYNPVAAVLHEQSKRMEAEFSGDAAGAGNDRAPASGCGSAATDGQSIMNAATSREQGVHARQRDGVRLRPQQPLHGTHRGEARRRSSPASGGSRTLASTPSARRRSIALRIC